jgi:hypothetical protein
VKNIGEIDTSYFLFVIVAPVMALMEAREQPG